jgi:phage baseplate assembly protein W
MVSNREKLFGNDLRLVDRGGDLDLSASPRGDLALALGNENIVQALELRLKVRKGELSHLGLPDYGSRLYELIGEPNNDRRHLKAMAFARSALEGDTRVAEVTDIRMEILSGEQKTVRLIMEIYLIHEPNPRNLVFDLNLEG